MTVEDKPIHNAAAAAAFGLIIEVVRSLVHTNQRVKGGRCQRFNSDLCSPDAYTSEAWTGYSVLALCDVFWPQPLIKLLVTCPYRLHGEFINVEVETIADSQQVRRGICLGA